jgi:D-alanyl-D-alanine carboxypeptidase/D-alanyl-D-alanine-endopeptidase (penicillin-binding protein 4)
MAAFSSRFLLRLFSGASMAILLGVPMDRTQAVPPPVCPNQLSGEIDAIVNRPNFARSRFGILIQSLGKRETLYAKDAQRFFIPASNVKLFTTAAALQTLKSTYRIPTSIYGTYKANGWHLRLVGRGDPSLTDAQLKELVHQLKHLGIRNIALLAIDDTHFDGDATNEDWSIGDVQAAYGAPINSVILNQNALDFKVFPQALGQPLRVQWKDPRNLYRWRVENRSTTVAKKSEEFVVVGQDLRQPILKVSGQLRVGAEPESTAIAVLDPAEHVLRHFQTALTAEQITVKQSQVIRQGTPSDGVEVARIDSPPLAELMKEANGNSNNLYTESFLRTIGAQTKASGGSVVERGLSAIPDVLKPLGVDPTGFSLADGAGLSRQNLVSPEAIVQVLQVMAQQPEGTVYRSSLAIAGVSGTLLGRFQDSPAKGIVQAKTGTLTGVAALSGYVNPPNYSPLAFSILVNQSTDPASVQRGAIDEIVGVLARLRSCP